MLVSDFIVDFLAKKNVSHCFTVTGGFAMFLNDSFGKHDSIKNIYNHNEQGCGYSAIGYTKSSNKPCVVSTTAGVAATNTVSSILVAWQESLPILYITGQVNSHETIAANPTLRHYSGQDCNIVEIVKSITKYSVEIHDPLKIRYELEKLFYSMTSGRMGPCLISVPLNVQNANIDPNTLAGFEYPIIKYSNFASLELTDRPLIVAGNGIKQSNSEKHFKDFVEKYNIPFVVTYNGVDVVSSEHPLYIGRCGINGDRSGNFAMQNCNMLIIMGARMPLGVVGYNPATFSRCSKKIMIDIDESELNKTNISIDEKVHSDVRTYIKGCTVIPCDTTKWVESVTRWKHKWFRDLPPNVDSKSPYLFYHGLMKIIPDNTCLVSSSGAIHTPLVHSFNDFGKNVKFIMNSSTGDMGSEVPGSLGIYFNGLYKNVMCVVGDGSFMFNVQELQTIRHHNTNIKIIVMNNGGYESIRVTQRNYFAGNMCGTDSDSGLSFPDFKDISKAFGINYHKFSSFEKLTDIINCDECFIVEVECCGQDRHPKLSSFKAEDGAIKSRPLEDMYPFIDRNELKTEMCIDIIE